MLVSETLQFLKQQDVRFHNIRQNSDLKTVFHFSSPAAHPNLSKTRDGTPQNVASGNKTMHGHMAINTYLRINLLYENAAL
jgi:hypothetical protein